MITRYIGAISQCSFFPPLPTGFLNFVTSLYYNITATNSQVHIYVILARFFSTRLFKVGTQEQNCTNPNHHKLALP